MSEVVKMPLEGAARLLESHFNFNQSTPNPSAHLVPLLLGPSGIGKTAIVEQFAEAVGAHMETIHGSHYTPADMLGIGVPVHGEFTKFLQPEMFQRLNAAAKSGDPVVLFIDELTHMSPTMLALAMQLTLERRVANHTLPDSTFVVLAGNRKEDGGPLFNISPILTSRCVTVEVTPPTFNAWARWAVQNNVAPEVIGFLARYPQYLHDWDRARLVNPTPRAWERVGLTIASDMPADDRAVTIQGLVGSKAVELEAVLRLKDRLPSVEDILRDPAGAPVPEPGDLASMFMTASMLTQHADTDNIGDIAIYVARMPLDVQVMVQKTLMDIDPGLSGLLLASPAFSDYFERVGALV